MKAISRATTLAAIGAGLVAAAASGEAASYVQTNLVSDIGGLAQLTDSSLRNPWGLAHSATSPIWIADQGAGVSTLYNVGPSLQVSINPLVVTLPTTGSGPQGPTGMLFAGVPGAFTISNGAGASGASTFIFANLNGTIDGWNPAVPPPPLSTHAFTGVPATGALYTGVALGTSSQGPTLYAANGAQGRIDVFDSGFNKITLAGNFTDPNLPTGYVPFNVRVINGKVYVTYAPAGRPAQTGATPGQGAIAVFDLDGNFLQELAGPGEPGSTLAAPWGIALAPADFGQFGGDLLVGNFSFGASEISALDPGTGTFLGTIPIATGSASAGGLWSLDFGTGGNNGTPETLFFTDGINGERDGLFGALTANVPEPASAGLLGLGLLLVAARRRR